MISLRTPETEEEYQKYMETHDFEKSCPLCRQEPTKVFNYWKVVPNEFPYDKIAETHDMLVLGRHAADDDITEEEELELRNIKLDYVNGKYDYIIEAVDKQKSIPAHHHVHLIVSK